MSTREELEAEARTRYPLTPNVREDSAQNAKRAAFIAGRTVEVRSDAWFDSMRAVENYLDDLTPLERDDRADVAIEITELVLESAGFIIESERAT